VAGMPPLRRADDRRIPGWRVLREYLREDAPAALHISSACPTLIHSLSSLRFDPLRIEDAADHPHDITHAPEALRYAVMSRPVAPASEDLLLLPRRQRGYWI
ncbi:MAG: hypothetical protein IKL84_08240, partial [Clostridia bacterium]|nr:hypothetical protein [Clostridia bacterium]